MPGNVYPTTEARALLNYARREIYAPDADGRPSKNHKAILTPGFLRLEVVLSANAAATAWNNIPFAVLTNDTQTTGQAQRTSEVRLDPPNAFLVDRIGFFLGSRAVANAQSAMILETFENTATFTGAGMGAAMRTLYNGGRLNVKVDSTEWIRKMDMLSFRYVSTAQNAVAPSVGDLWEASAYRLDDILYQMTPAFWLNGGSLNEINVALSDQATFTGTAASDAVAVLYLKGILAQNAGAFNPNVSK